MSACARVVDDWSGPAQDTTACTVHCTLYTVRCNVSGCHETQTHTLTVIQYSTVESLAFLTVCCRKPTPHRPIRPQPAAKQSGTEKAEYPFDGRLKEKQAPFVMMGHEYVILFYPYTMGCLD